jgi:hypothetical protein
VKLLARKLMIGSAPHMPDSTKIHFADGESVVVTQGIRAVVETLGKTTSLAKFTRRNNGRPVYVAGSQVTHIEQLPGEKPAATEKQPAGAAARPKPPGPRA